MSLDIWLVTLIGVGAVVGVIQWWRQFNRRWLCVTETRLNDQEVLTRSLEIRHEVNVKKIKDMLANHGSEVVYIVSPPDMPTYIIVEFDGFGNRISESRVRGGTISMGSVLRTMPTNSLLEFLDTLLSPLDFQSENLADKIYESLVAVASARARPDR